MHGIFRERRVCELRRMPIPRTKVNTATPRPDRLKVRTEENGVSSGIYAVQTFVCSRGTKKRPAAPMGDRRSGPGESGGEDGGGTARVVFLAGKELDLLRTRDDLPYAILLDEFLRPSLIHRLVFRVVVVGDYPLNGGMVSLDLHTRERVV